MHRSWVVLLVELASDTHAEAMSYGSLVDHGPINMLAG